MFKSEGSNSPTPKKPSSQKPSKPNEKLPETKGTGDTASIKAGDATKGGREFTGHGAERANERGFSSEQIDNIINNNKNTRVKEIDPEDGSVTWRYQDKRGNTVITNEWGDKVVTVYSYPQSANGGNYIPKNKKGCKM
ncbi:hypothetical protein ACM1RC_32520 [Paenibacillus azoreducens]|uniref:hypothetical protein n=1 Tax=Paenibacillus azoreducens TaxID=116718 RepID=UPI0039F63A1B